jgi:hypothetical protein
MGWTTEGSEFESRWGEEFSLLQIIQTGSEVHPTSYQMGAKVKKMWIYTSTPIHLHGVVLN